MDLCVSFLTMLAWVVGGISILLIVGQWWRAKKFVGELADSGISYRDLRLEEKDRIARNFPIKKPALALVVCIVFLIAKAIV